PLTVAFQTDGIACGSVVRNSATIATSAREDNLDNNRSQTVMTTVQCPPPPPPPTADLGIQKLALRSSVQPGDIIAYRLTVSNAGPDAAANVSIVDPIPSDLSFLDSLGDAGSTGVDGPLPFLLPPSTCTQQGRRVVCNVATIASGGNRTVLLRFKVSDSAQCNGSIQNAASVSASTPDPNLGNNQSDTVSTRVDCPPLQTADLGIQKVPFSFTVRPGDFLTYRLTVTNDGPSSAANVSATDSIPKDLTFIDVLTDQDHPGLYGPLPSPLPFLTCSRRDSTIVCTTPHLPPGTSRSAFLHFRVSPAASCNQVIRNMASVSSTTEDRNLRNNQTQASVFVECPPPTFTIKKTDNRDTIRPGENDTYRIMVTNTSPFAATTIITDFFPTQLLDFQSASDNGTLHGGRIVWNNLSFTPGETKTLTVQAQAHGDLSDGTVITNEAQVDLDGTATDTTTVVVPPKFGCILVNKEADNPDGNPLPTVPQFTFRLENGQHTQNNASGVATFANVPAGQHTVSEILPLEWTQQQINPAGGIVTVVPGPACASVAIRNRQNPIGNPTFSITKTDNKRTANPGDFVTYTITVTNTSPVDASNVSVVDQLPAGQLTFLFSSDNGQLNGQTVTWSGLSIPKQSTRMLTVFAQVNAGLSGGTSITNTAQVVGGPTTTDTITVIGGQQNGCISIVKEGFTATGANVSILPQFTFQLENGQTIQNDSTGQATFQNVSLGTHTVTEQSLSGWNQIFVTPSNGVVNVTAGACVGVTFKNQKIAVGTPTFAITKTVNHATAAPGDALVYTITVTNTSNVTGAATVNDTLPSGLTFVNASENGSANGQTVTWNTLVIPANSTKVITLTALANSNLINGTVITNIATVTGGATATDTTTIQTSTSGNVSLTINDYPDPVRPCDTLNYAINVTNFSSQQNLTVTQILSNRTSFTFASDGGAERNGTITWNTLSVPTGSTKTLTVSVRVSCGARDGDILRTTVTAGNASAEATTRVIEDFRNNRNISLDIRDAPDPVRACDTLDYTLTVRNDNGDNDVTVRAVLDPQTSFLSASGNGYERSRGQVEWRNVFLSRSDLTTLRLTVRIDCGARDGDTLRLHGQADGATADETTRVINDRNVLVPVPIAPVVGTISVTKQADRSNAAPNDEIAYTITVTNTSQASLTGMQVIDSFTPGQVQLFDVPQVSGGQAVWTIDSLAPNQVRTIVYRARVSGSARNGDVLHNSVTVQGGNLPTPGFASSDVRVVSSLPQTGGGQFSDPLSLARLFSHSPADQAAASIPLILWSTIAAIGSVSGGLLGRRFFF
ncbi:DUF11 domain-containing protein, partial [Candidatus Peregrinibacteria bacterium]|nr:DUF11 domain-containing protein [Candidatus Peregrinibacteria bacterium]